MMRLGILDGRDAHWDIAETQLIPSLQGNVQFS